MSDHLYNIKLKDQVGITQHDERDLDEFTAWLKSGDAELLNGEVKVNSDDVLDVHEIPNPDMRNVA